MHPKALLDVCSELVRLTLKFDHPTDAVVSKFFRENRGLGPRERATLAETVYAVLRRKLQFDHFAPSGSGPRERRAEEPEWGVRSPAEPVAGRVPPPDSVGTGCSPCPARCRC